jgi:probable aminopeptidase NPEPL1
VARAFTHYSRKNRGGAPSHASTALVNVEFICPSGDHIGQEELLALGHAAYGIKLSAKIVAAPCSEMHCDAFLDVRRSTFYLLNHKLFTK